MNTAIVVLILGQVANAPLASPQASVPNARYRAAVASALPDTQTADNEPVEPESKGTAATPGWLIPEGGKPKTTEPLDLSRLAFKMFLGTAGVIAAAIASIYLGRQWIEKRRPAEPLGRQLRVLETKALAPRVSLQLVDAAGQMVLVGVDANGIKGMLRLTGAFEDAWQEATEAVADNAE